MPAVKQSRVAERAPSCSGLLHGYHGLRSPAAEAPRCRGSDSPELLDREGGDKGVDVFGGMIVRPSGLFMPLAIFATSLS